MHDTVNQGDVPRGALVGAALLVGFALVAVFISHQMHLNATPLPAARAVTVLQLAFRDRSDGGVDVLDAEHANALVHVVQPNTGGFVRGVLRSLARARRSVGVGPEPAFTLTRWSDGRMTLDDPQTHQHINLEVFGPTNSKPFAALFSPDPTLVTQAGPIGATTSRN
jgi:putative photosynthetic complex assembly protein